MTRQTVAIVATLVLAACATTPTQSVGPGLQFDARPGDTVHLGGSGTTIAIESVADSRCPIDVQCISAGDVVVAVRFSGDAGSRADTLRLAAPPHSVRYGTQHLELLDVRPLPRSTDINRVSTAVLRVTVVQ
jgi:hypothetical protein